MDVEVFSFFSGLGFLDLGFENAGFNIVFVNEYKLSVAIYSCILSYLTEIKSGTHQLLLGVGLCRFCL